MKKKILVVSLSLFSMAAFADVNLYGKLIGGVENDQFQNNTIPGTSSVQDYGSYFGIRGSDPVYGETSAIWQVEQYLDLTTGQAYASTTGGNMIVPNPAGGTNHVNNEVNTLASSESYLGLQGGWGRVRLGNLSNYMRSNMGVVDIYNYGNGVNGMGLWSRTNRLIPTAFRYDSPTWAGFNFVALYGFNSSGLSGVSGINGSNDFGTGLGGVYSGGVYSLGLGWSGYNFSVNLGTTVWQQVGNYQTGTAGLVPGTGATGAPTAGYPNSTYSNAYAARLEAGYNDPDGLIVGLGFQIASGLGWSSWANSGGSLGFNANPGTQTGGLSTNQLQTQEAAVSVGWHVGPWTPKLGYVYGNNMMYGGDVGNVISGNANQIANSGYQQALAELDWNITPRAIVFVNYGQAWFGNTLSNVAFSTPTNPPTPVNGNNAYENNQSSVAIGFSDTF